MRKPFAVLVAFAFIFLPKQAFGHATPVAESPRNGASVNELPQRIQIRFSERVEANASGMRILVPGTSTPTKIETIVSPHDPRTFEGIVPPSEASGAYTVYWNVVSSDDGHFTRGAFSFAVGTTSTASLGASYIETIRRSSGLESASVFLEFLGQSLLLGLLLLGIHKKSRTVALVAVGFILIGIIGYLSSVALTLADYETISFGESLNKLVRTNSGTFAVLRIIASIIAFATITRFPRTSGFFLATALIFRASASHAAASVTLTLFSVAINSLHLFAKEAWIGTIIIFSLTPSLWETYQAQRIRTTLFLWIGGTTGAYIVWLHLKDILNIQHTEWGAWFALLLLCSTAFLGAHLLGARRAQTQLVYGEAILGLVVLYLSAVLATTTPPTKPHAPIISMQSSNGIEITVKERPDFENELVVAVTGDTETIQEPIITLEDANSSEEPAPLPVEKISENGYGFKKALLGASEKKVLRVQVPQANAYDATAVFNFTAPLTDTGQTRTKTLALFCILVSIGLTLIAYLLYQSARKHTFTLVPGEPPYGPLTALALTILFINAQLLPSSFQRQCIKDGNYWHFSAPVRAGISTATVAKNGCAFGFGAGLFHFNDEDEYRYFTRPADTKVAITTSPEKPQPGKATTFEIKITNSENKPIHELIATQNSLLTVSIIPEDMDSITNLAVDSSTSPGVFTTQHVFNKSGRYHIVIQGSHRTTPFSQSFSIDTGNLLNSEQKIPTEKYHDDLDGYRITLERPEIITAHTKTPLLFKIELADEGVSDLQSTGDTLLVLRSLRTDGMFSTYATGKAPSGGHSHSVKKERIGPYVVVPAYFPEPGTYVHFVEFKHKGKTRTGILVTDVKN